MTISRRGLLGASLTLAAGGSGFARMVQAAETMPSSALVAEAKHEGALNLVALSHNWAFEPLMKTFSARYGIAIDDSNSEGSSAEELQAVRSLRHADRAPDCMDLSPAFAALGTQQKLLAPYKVSTWAEIPTEARDASGHWVGDYFGIISFAVNRKVVTTVPRTWNDLLKPEYRGMVAMDGSPLGSGDAFAAVMAANLASGGSVKTIAPGVEFFARLAHAGNLNPIAVTEPSLVSGQTPIVLRWDYLNLTSRDNAAKMAPIEVVVPEGAAPFGAFYAQAISAFAPHPKAARLWQEFLYSNEGQLGFLAQYAHPIRFNAMLAAGAIPPGMLAKLPAPDAYKAVQFASLDQTNAAKKTLSDLWTREVKVG
ncbi:ABC transporter substrate-binding protein [Acidisoma cladoniae]|jgi:putative spermidine/putrescine transport system substrate-binding protein|uniref:ABC transporter substrate-binding protein n=1 Tax=Acidisoma cladoniae TaxID=3040935 RepID=UPI00254B57F6|nr:ABC transporter substrate-binding protein [Acidisoma sp. PAMC 29798]